MLYWRSSFFWRREQRGEEATGQMKERETRKREYLTSSRGRQGGVRWPVGQKWLLQLPLLNVMMMMMMMMMMMSLEHSQLISNTDGKMQHK
jgi:hypothetical protein